MGHHLFICDNKSLPMGDFDVALIKHFLVEGANRLGDHAIARAVSEWNYQGPGVWVGIDEAVFVNQEAVFDVAIGIVQQLGESVSVDYLNKNAALPGGWWQTNQPTSDVVSRIRKLKEHLVWH